MAGRAPLDITEGEVRKALKEAPSVLAAARSLGISRRTIYRYMVRYGIAIERIVT